MAYSRFEPGAMFGDAVEVIWDWHIEPGEFAFERVLPVPGTGIIFNLAEDETRVYEDDALRRCVRADGSVFDGQYTRSFLIDTAEQTAVIGVMLRPGGAAHFFGEPMHRLVDRHCTIEDFAGGSGSHALRQRLLHTPSAQGRIALVAAWLQKRYRADALHPAVRVALNRLSRQPCVTRIETLIADSGYSARRFGALFDRDLGIGPKRFARLKRFRAVVDAVTQGRRVEWASVAADCGFHDQPHLVREFRAFAGLTPTEYLATRGSKINHIVVAAP